MVEIIEAKDWSRLTGAFIIDVGSLEDLKKVAEGFQIPVIFRKKKEYLIVYGSVGQVPLCYRFKE